MTTNRSDEGTARSAPDHPPEAWRPGRLVALSIARPLRYFLRMEAASGLLLVFATGLALTWANVPSDDSYGDFWRTAIGFAIGGEVWELSLREFVNEGLMVLFFLVVGLEIRREIYHGHLASWRAAALPIVGALGGILVPALIYRSINPLPPGSSGWGVPVATDIAFAVGIMALLGKRVTPTLRVLLLSIAIADDIGATLIITLFYSSDLVLSDLGISLAGVLLIVFMQKLGFRRTVAFVPGAGLIWLGLHHSGIHPALGGVAIGLMTPVRTWFGPSTFDERARNTVTGICAIQEREDMSEQELVKPLSRLSWMARECVSPVVWLEAALHPWVAFGVMPVFALANAGIRIESETLMNSGAQAAALGIVAGLVIGKPLGIVGSVWIGTRLGLFRLPADVRWAGLGVVGCVGGVGFTMALFIGTLAFDDASLVGASKLAILVGSTLAAVVGLAVGAAALRPPTVPTKGPSVTA